MAKLNIQQLPDFKGIIEQMRVEAGRIPRTFESRNRVRMGFLQKIFDKELGQQVSKAKLLFEEGQIVWGSLVQANTLLFQPGSNNLPGCVLYSIDPRMDPRPLTLAECASELFSYKGKKNLGNPALQKFADRLQDEVSRPLGLQVPPSLTEQMPCQMSVIQFERNHLLDGRISGQIMPILTHPDTPSIMMLPRWYWPEAFIKGHGAGHF